MPYRSSLSSLHITQHPPPTLTKLWRGQVNLSTLSVAHSCLLPLMVEILKYEGSGFRGVQSLDLSQIPLKDKDAELVGEALLVCNKLQSLEVSFHVGATALGVHHLMDPLTRGACPSLHYLGLYCDFFYRPTTGQEVALGLESGHMKRLDELIVTGFMLGDDGATAMARSLSMGSCPLLRVLSLSNCGVGAEGACSLAQALQSGLCKNLVALSLRHNYMLGEEGLCAIAHALAGQGCPQLGRLDLSNTGMTPASAAALAVVLSSGSCPSLRYIDLSSNRQVGDQAMGQVVAGLGGAIHHIDFHNTGMDELATYALVQAVRSGTWPGLKYLDVADAAMRQSRSIPDLIEALSSTCHELHYLSFTYSTHHTGEDTLIAGLQRGVWPKLEELRVASHSSVMQSRLWCGLARVLQGGAAPQLRKMRLEGVCSHGGKALVEALKKGACPDLEEVEVYGEGSHVDWEGAVADRHRKVEVYGM